MKFSSAAAVLAAVALVSFDVAESFALPRCVASGAATSEKGVATRRAAATDNETIGPKICEEKNQQRLGLGLLTFDLDDTLFPIGPVVADANDAMIDAISKLGYRGITNNDVLSATRRIRKEIAARDTVITYTELRMRAIRAELERFLSEQFTLRSGDNEVVHPSVVQHIFDAWLAERNASASRRLFDDALSVLEAIRSSHPSAVIGAVTNGRGDPLDMPDTLGQHFDFCVSGEDEGVFPHRKPHRGIYDAAWRRYEELRGHGNGGLSNAQEELAWVHVGDDLANDVGASAKCGARAIWLDMSEEKGGGRAVRSAVASSRPSWSTATPEEVERRRNMANLARESVSARIEVLGELPGAIDGILLGQR